LSTNKSSRFLRQCTTVSSTTVVAVAAVEDSLSAKVAGNESVDGRMTMTKSDGGQNATTNQRMAARRRRQREVGGSLATARRRQLRWWRQRESGRRRKFGGSATARRWRLVFLSFLSQRAASCKSTYYLFCDRMHRTLAKFGRSNDYSPMTLVEGN
jgi:hypothetical protein